MTRLQGESSILTDRRAGRGGGGGGDSTTPSYRRAEEEAEEKKEEKEEWEEEVEEAEDEEEEDEEEDEEEEEEEAVRLNGGRVLVLSHPPASRLSLNHHVACASSAEYSIQDSRVLGSSWMTSTDGKIKVLPGVPSFLVIGTPNTFFRPPRRVVEGKNLCMT